MKTIKKIVKLREKLDLERSNKPIMMYELYQNNIFVGCCDTTAFRRIDGHSVKIERNIYFFDKNDEVIAEYLYEYENLNFKNTHIVYDNEYEGECSFVEGLSLSILKHNPSIDFKEVEKYLSMDIDHRYVYDEEESDERYFHWIEDFEKGFENCLKEYQDKNLSLIDFLDKKMKDEELSFTEPTGWYYYENKYYIDNIKQKE